MEKNKKIQLDKKVAYDKKVAEARKAQKALYCICPRKTTLSKNSPSNEHASREKKI